MLDLVTTAQFRKDLKRLRKRGADIRKLDGALKILCAEKPLPERYRDHALVSDYIGFRECHISLDWLLVYAVDKGKLILTASRTGSHADLFQPILWDRLFLLLFYADVPSYGTFSSLKSEEPAPAPLCNKKAETGSFHCVLLRCQHLPMEVLARLGAHGHVVLCEGTNPGTVGRVREDDVGGAEIRAGGVDGGIPCGAVHNLRPAREAARVVRHVGDDIAVCHDPIKARPFAAQLPHLHREDVLRTHGENAVCTSKGRQSENTRSVVPFYQ